MKKILVIEDEVFVRENIVELLDAEGYAVTEAENGRLGVDAAKASLPDLILCDITMSELDGYAVLATLRRDPALAATPFIFLTAKAAKVDFRQGMELGADDYVTKPFTRAELLGAITSRLKKQAVVVDRHSTELQQVKAQLNYLIHHDGLTNLPNRLSLRELFQQVRLTGNTQKPFLTILRLDLDQFSQIDDNLGHTFGDALLKAVAERLTACVSSRDTVVHLNVNQFAIILVTTQQKKDAANVAQMLLKNLSQPFVLEGQEVFITANIGMALYPHDGTDVEQLLRFANLAMAQAKQQGGERYKFYTTAFNKSSSDHLALQTSLRHALERDELQVYYQPQVNLRTGQIVGSEALVRWQHPERGLVAPTEFVPLAEEMGLIQEIGEWVLHTACKQTKAWQMEGFTSLRVAVNLSSSQFSQIDSHQRLVQILSETGLGSHHIELELTESTLVQNAELAIRRLNALKGLGVAIAIDDFGTGYSSLSYLQQFPFDILKIDRCFIRNIQADSSKAVITRAIIQMAKSLNLRLIAEGVETEAELLFVRQQQCDDMQGYLFSRPVPTETFKQLLITGKQLPTPLSLWEFNLTNLSQKLGCHTETD